jgi:hypothetical protein
MSRATRRQWKDSRARIKGPPVTIVNVPTDTGNRVVRLKTKLEHCVHACTVWRYAGPDDFVGFAQCDVCKGVVS